MSAGDPTAKTFSLRRWSQRKLAAARAASEPAAIPEAAPALPPAAPGASQGSAAPATETAGLPPVESLTIDSDFTAFLQPKVDETLKRQALKQLFRDPRFNVMDGLDVYIDDYSIPDPISPDVVRQLVQARHVFDPPQTRVNERGEVEDVPPGEGAVVAPGAGSETLTGVDPGTATSPDCGPAGLPEAAPDASAGAAADVGAGTMESRVGAAVPAAPAAREPAPR